ncbi:hypothetical protein MKX01_025395, partial [Papaver californicum]
LSVTVGEDDMVPNDYDSDDVDYGSGEIHVPRTTMNHIATLILISAIFWDKWMFNVRIVGHYTGWKKN